MNARTLRAVLHRLNRNQRLMISVADTVCLGFRCLPPILWEWSQRACDCRKRAGEAGSHGERMLRAIFGETGREFLPWRVTDVLGMTDRRRTPQGKLWHAEDNVRRWRDRGSLIRERYGVSSDEEGAIDGA